MPAEFEYSFQISGKENGEYTLEILNEEKGNEFTANEIPTKQNEIHEYNINWEKLNESKEGVNIQIDTNGDGTVDNSVVVDNSFSSDEYNRTIEEEKEEKEEEPFIIVILIIIIIITIIIIIGIIFIKKRGRAKTK